MKVHRFEEEKNDFFKNWKQIENKLKKFEEKKLKICWKKVEQKVEQKLKKGWENVEEKKVKKSWK